MIYLLNCGIFCQSAGSRIIPQHGEESWGTEKEAGAGGPWLKKKEIRWSLFIYLCVCVCVCVYFQIIFSRVNNKLVTS